MNKLLDRIKQGLRNIGRGSVERAARRPATPSEEEAVPEQRMRTELDAAHTLTRPHAPVQPLVQAHQPTSVRLRKATLSKARRTGPSQNAPSIWGAASSPAGDGLFGTPAEPAPLLSGAALAVHHSPDGEPQRPRNTGGFLEGAPPFGRPSDAPTPGDTLFGPAPSLAPSDEPKDRLF
jgi:hypothetical protein